MRKRWNLGTIIALILLIILVLYNIVNNENFFELSIGTLLTLFIAIFISFYLVQKNTDQRYQKQIYYNLLLDIQKFVTNPDTYSFDVNTDIRTITLKKRILSNYIGIAYSYSKKFNLEQEINFIKEKFKEYDKFIGDHISDINYLSKSKDDLRRPLDLINYRLYEMMLKLYD